MRTTQIIDKWVPLAMNEIRETGPTSGELDLCLLRRANWSKTFEEKKYCYLYSAYIERRIKTRKVFFILLKL
jgi:hypothetical protein